MVPERKVPVRILTAGAEKLPTLPVAGVLPAL
jgi:hypothetical protein